MDAETACAVTRRSEEASTATPQVRRAETRETRSAARARGTRTSTGAVVKLVTAVERISRCPGEAVRFGVAR